MRHVAGSRIQRWRGPHAQAYAQRQRQQDHFRTPTAFGISGLRRRIRRECAGIPAPTCRWSMPRDDAELKTARLITFVVNAPDIIFHRIDGYFRG